MRRLLWRHLGHVVGGNSAVRDGRGGTRRYARLNVLRAHPGDFLGSARQGFTHIAIAEKEEEDGGGEKRGTTDAAPWIEVGDAGRLGREGGGVSTVSGWT